MVLWGPDLTCLYGDLSTFHRPFVTALPGPPSGFASSSGTLRQSVIQDLLSGMECNKLGICVLLDEDPDIGGLYGLYPSEKDK